MTLFASRQQERGLHHSPIPAFRRDACLAAAQSCSPGRTAVIVMAVVGMVLSLWVALPSSFPEAAAAENEQLNGDWIRQPLGQLAGRSNAVMAPAQGPQDPDPEPEQVLLFGGQSAGLVLGDTWVWDGTTWTSQRALSGPSRRFGAAMAYHRATKRTVLFGGEEEGTGVVADTWEWDGTRWEEAEPEDVPPARRNAALAQDVNGDLVLFGGDGLSGVLGDTWVWNGVTWREVTPEQAGSPCDQQDQQPGVADSCKSPPARGARPGMAYFDAQSEGHDETTLLFGGSKGAFADLDDMWAWDGARWHEVTLPSASGAAGNPPIRPEARSSPGFAYHEDLKRVVLFGGQKNFQPLRDTWTWNGEAWTEQHPAQRPPADSPGNGMAFWEPSADADVSGASAASHVLVLSNIVAADIPLSDDSSFGLGGDQQADVGLYDTWTWDGRTKGALLPVPPPDPTDTLPPVPEPDPIETSATLALAADPEAIPANGQAESVITATVTSSGGDARKDRQVSFTFGGDLTYDSNTCTTGIDGKCRITVRASITPGVEKIRGETDFASPYVIEITEWELPCEEQRAPASVPGWWANLDLDFGCHGRAFPRPFDGVVDMAAHRDEKIVVLARSQSEGSTYLVRYNSDGTLDGGADDSTPEDGDFGTGGVVRIAGAGLSHLVIQPGDGKIVAGGFPQPVHTGAIQLFRFNSDGTPDKEAFGSDGRVALPEIDHLTALALQPDGKLLAAGFDDELRLVSDPRPAILTRLNPDGSRDNGELGVDADPKDWFAPDRSGTITVEYRDGASSEVNQIDIQRFGDEFKIVLGGGSYVAFNFTVVNHWGLARLLPNGDFDLSFNPCPSAHGACGTGKSMPVFESNNEVFRDLLIQPSDNKIVAVGTVVGPPSRVLLARFEPDGPPDFGFNACTSSPPPCGGKTSSSFGQQKAIAGVVDLHEPDGKIVVGGYGENAEMRGHLLARFTRDGVLDDRCGSPGHIVTDYDAASGGVIQVIVQEDGRILAGGQPNLLRFQGGSLTSAPSEITVQGATVNEPKAGHTEAPFNVKLKLDAPACQTMAFDYATSDGTATAGQDYTQTNGRVMFKRGEQERIVPVPVLPDNHPEPPETFSMSVSNPIGLADPTRPKELRLPVVKLAEGEAKILDPQPEDTKTQASTQPALSIGDTSVIETNQAGTASFPVALSAHSSKKITVAYRTQDDTAQAPGDYSAATGTVTFDPGQTQKTLTVNIAGDTVPEPTESFHVELKDPTGANLQRPRATATIYNDDSAGAQQPPAKPTVASTVPTAAGVLVPGANLSPPAMVQGTQIQAQQQIQQQVQQQVQAQLMAGLMSERQKQVEIEKAGLQGKDAYLATARRQTSPSFAWAFGWIAALAAIGASMVYGKQASSQPAVNSVRRRSYRRSS